MRRFVVIAVLFAPGAAAAQITWDPPAADAGAPPEEAPIPVPDAGSPLPMAAPPDGGPSHPNAGHAAGWFFLRSDDDNFIFIPSGRLQVDFFAHQGGTDAPPNLFLIPRARIEALGTVLKHWDFDVGGEFSTGAQPTDVDAYLNANYTTYANVQLGQFDAPFTMENRTNDKWTDLQSRSSVVTALGVPANKALGAMVWGQPEGRWAYWSGGVFNGQGVNNLPSGFGDFDVMGRAWIAPFGLTGLDLIRNIWVGASGWVGNRQSTPLEQVDRSAMVDAAQVTFWSPVVGSLHAGDQGTIEKWGLEFNVPVGSVVLKGEAVNDVEQLRELDESIAANPVPIRNGTLNGTGYYGRASFFVWGDALINGLAGSQDPPHLFGKLTPDSTADALQLVANADHLSWTYKSGGASSLQDPLVGDFSASIFGAGINYWYSKHLRLTVNFLYDVFNATSQRPELSNINSYEVTLRAALAL